MAHAGGVLKALRILVVPMVTVCCSSELQVATSAGTGSAQSAPTKTEAVKSQTAQAGSPSDRAGKQDSGNASNAGQASTPSNIVGSNENFISPDGSASDGIAISPQAIGVARCDSKAGAPQSNSNCNSVPGAVNAGSDPSVAPPGVISAAPMGITPVNAGAVGPRWTDTGDLSTLSLHCDSMINFSNQVWQSDCRVVTPVGIVLNLADETTSKNWTVTSAPGCVPTQAEDSVPGMESVYHLMYVGPAKSTCVPATILKLVATTYMGQTFTVTKTFSL